VWAKEVKVEVDAQEVGCDAKSLPAQVEGKPLEIAFNIRDLLEGLKRPGQAMGPCCTATCYHSGCAECGRLAVRAHRSRDDRADPGVSFADSLLVAVVNSKSSLAGFKLRRAASRMEL